MSGPPSGPQDGGDVAGRPAAGSPVEFELLNETDALLDRLGARTPSPGDLDDPIAAALAVFAAGIDLDRVPVARTRRALSAAGLLPAAPYSAVYPAGHPSGPAAAALAGDRELPTLLPAVAHGPSGPSGPSGPGADPTGHSATVDAGGFDGSGGEAGELPAAVRLRLLPLLAATGSAVLLSMGAAAAVSGGQSVNPAQVVRFVVGQVQGIDPAPGSPATEPAGVGQPGHGSVTPVERSAGGPSSTVTGSSDPTGPFLVPPALPTAQIAGGALPAGASPAPSDPVPSASDQPAPTDSPSDPAQTSPVPSSPSPGAGSPSPSASGDPSPSPSSSAAASPAPSSPGRHGGGHGHSPRPNQSSPSPSPSPSQSHD